MITIRLFEKGIKIRGLLKNQQEADEVSSIIEKTICDLIEETRWKAAADKILEDKEIFSIVLKLAVDFYKLKVLIEECEGIIEGTLEKLERT